MHPHPLRVVKLIYGSEIKHILDAIKAYILIIGSKLIREIQVSVHIKTIYNGIALAIYGLWDCWCP